LRSARSAGSENHDWIGIALSATFIRIMTTNKHSKLPRINNLRPVGQKGQIRMMMNEQLLLLAVQLLLLLQHPFTSSLSFYRLDALPVADGRS